MMINANYRAARGNSIVLIAFMMFTLIAFLGLATYAGLNAYLQSELQKAVTYAAGVGASTRFDDMTAGGSPIVENDGVSMGAATSAFNRLVGQSPALQSFGAVLTNVRLINNTLRMDASVAMPTPMFSLIGINQITIGASSTANYARKNLPVDRFEMNTASGPYVRVMTLDPPLMNGPGPDLFIAGEPTDVGAFHGYMVELCYNNGSCRDISSAAKSAGGVIVDRTYLNGETRRVLYGAFNFDVESFGGPGYANNVARATAIKIIDDGVPDARLGDQRYLELNPQPTRFTNVVMYHQAVYCVDENNCVAPGGFSLF